MDGNMGPLSPFPVPTPPFWESSGKRHSASLRRTSALRTTNHSRPAQALLESINSDQSKTLLAEAAESIPIGSMYLVGGFNPFEKYYSEIGSFPLVGMKIKNISNHHLVYGIFTSLILQRRSLGVKMFPLKGDAGVQDAAPEAYYNKWIYP